MDYTIIQAVSQHFGDKNPATRADDPYWDDKPFVGLSKSYRFKCPKVNTDQIAILQFEVSGSSQSADPENGLFVNNTHINSGVGLATVTNVDVFPNPIPNTNSPSQVRVDMRYLPVTKTRLISTNVLREDNELIITSNGDDFLIDNIVVFFKTKTRSRPIAAL